MIETINAYAKTQKMDNQLRKEMGISVEKKSVVCDHSLNWNSRNVFDLSQG